MAKKKIGKVVVKKKNGKAEVKKKSEEDKKGVKKKPVSNPQSPLLEL